MLMSATVNEAAFSAYFGNCPKLQIPGFTFSVKVWLRCLAQLHRLKRMCLTFSVCCWSSNVLGALVLLARVCLRCVKLREPRRSCIWRMCCTRRAGRPAAPAIASAAAAAKVRPVLISLSIPRQHPGTKCPRPCPGTKWSAAETSCCGSRPWSEAWNAALSSQGAGAARWWLQEFALHGLFVRSPVAQAFENFVTCGRLLERRADVAALSTSGSLLAPLQHLREPARSPECCHIYLGNKLTREGKKGGTEQRWAAARYSLPRSKGACAQPGCVLVPRGGQFSAGCRKVRRLT